MHQFTTFDQAADFLKRHVETDHAPADFPDAAAYLGQSGERRALPVLLEALEHGGTWVRATAARGLGYLGKREAIPSLTRRFLDDPNVYVRGDAALALGALASPESLEVLAQHFGDSPFEVQKRIIAALRAVQGSESAWALRRVKELTTHTSLSTEERSVLLGLLGDAVTGPSAGSRP